MIRYLLMNSTHITHVLLIRISAFAKGKPLAASSGWLAHSSNRSPAVHVSFLPLCPAGERGETERAMAKWLEQGSMNERAGWSKAWVGFLFTSSCNTKCVCVQFYTLLYFVCLKCTLTHHEITLICVSSNLNVFSKGPAVRQYYFLAASYVQVFWTRWKVRNSLAQSSMQCYTTAMCSLTKWRLIRSNQRFWVDRWMDRWIRWTSVNLQCHFWWTKGSDFYLDPSFSSSCISLHHRRLTPPPPANSYCSHDNHVLLRKCIPQTWSLLPWLCMLHRQKLRMIGSRCQISNDIFLLFTRGPGGAYNCTVLSFLSQPCLTYYFSAPFLHKHWGLSHA